MPVTRRQAALEESGVDVKTASKSEKPKSLPKKRGTKRDVEEAAQLQKLKDAEEPPEKKAKKVSEPRQGERNEKGKTETGRREGPMTGTIERGHIYFFYRPKVEHEKAHSIDDVQRFHMLLVPRPPEFATSSNGDPNGVEKQEDVNVDMQVLREGADAVPAKETQNKANKRYRLISIGKKQLPDPDHSRGRNSTFWATVTAVGNDLHSLEKGLGGKTYETKTRGTRHQGPSRLAGRGAYAIVNNDPRVPSKRETHLGYHLSHPSDMGEVQEALGIHTASSFVIQAKNPLAPPTGGQQVGLSPNKRADYPDWIMEEVFGKGGKKGRESYGLRFASVELIELLDYEGAELLFIAARSGGEGLEQSLGEGRGYALEELEKEEGREGIEEVFKELVTDSETFPAEAIEGAWV